MDQSGNLSEDRELTGAARSIIDLFQALESESDSPSSDVASELAEAAHEPAASTPVDATVLEPAPSDPLTDALRSVVEEYVAAGIDERPAMVDRVKEAIDVARASNLLDSLSEAMDAILLQTAGDAGARAMVKELMGAAVESRMAIRLGQVTDDERRDALIDAYAPLGTSMAHAVADALTETEERHARRTYMLLLVAMGSEGMSVVESMVEDSRWFVARNGVAVLGEIGGDRAIELLTGALANGNARVRREAVLSLAKIGGEDAGVLAMGMLDDAEAEVRAGAAQALSVLKVGRALRPLMDALEREDDPAVIERLLGALGQLGDPGAVQAIEKRATGGLLRKPPTDVRVAAYTALATIGTPHAMKVVEAASSDKDPAVRTAVQAVLR